MWRSAGRSTPTTTLARRPQRLQRWVCAGHRGAERVPDRVGCCAASNRGGCGGLAVHVSADDHTFDYFNVCRDGWVELVTVADSSKPEDVRAAPGLRHLGRRAGELARLAVLGGRPLLLVRPCGHPLDRPGRQLPRRR
ncbi:hypothetical protein Drose_15270 [Dactylosporangium roseum]|uniref:Uncharacterized protein n=1 Tax=Dactylosporangium roseum TaxID=47989 RepID=A0ABY5ZBH9_9ACTN|nr:hypothetical protein [Dactylosporangium roseum]UWZ39473.1 hypothetical protein Drose_15270 [Dactylosporangium roseum]